MKKIALIILDGWGIGNGSKGDAIANSKTPFYDYLLKNYPHSQLLTDGEHVGLPEGQMGNSEVGHLNIGAGRIVYQDLAKINKAVKDKTFVTNPVLLNAFEQAKKNNKTLHLMGLLSPGGIHSHEQHLYKLCDLAQAQGLSNVFIHAFMDGRDCDPKSGLKHITNLETHLKKSDAKLATLIGRYYAMDRDKRWERVKLAYDLLVNGIGKKFNSGVEAVNASYAENITDEFIKPVLINENGKIKEGDVVICFNFRTDRCREITTVFTQKDFPEFGMKTLSLHYVTMTNYDSTFKGIHIMYDKDDLKMTLGEVLSKAGKKQLRIAETEKYPHVTFFFSGGREKEFEGESRIVVPSQKVATYDLKPEMSAEEVSNAFVTAATPLSALPDSPSRSALAEQGGESTKAGKPGYHTTDGQMWNLLHDKAVKMKQSPTQAEDTLWQLLRNKTTSYNFRRQHIIGGYIVDFVCLEKKLVVEVDGDIHDYQKEEDAIRTAFLNRNKFEVIRFRNEEVISKPDEVIKKIIEKLDALQVLPLGEDSRLPDGQVGGVSPDFICLNFANPDMVGHTGVFSAVQKAVETVDACNKRVVEAGLANGYSFIIIADHGNAEYMINENGTPNTAHTTNPVDCVLIDSDYKKISNGKLADLAPTILTMMGIEIPKEMDGKILV